MNLHENYLRSMMILHPASRNMVTALDHYLIIIYIIDFAMLPFQRY